MRYKPRSVEDDPIAFLDDTRAEHNGIGSAELIAKLNAEIKKKRIADDCGVDESTLYRWIRALKLKGIWSEPSKV